jgi:hypothetical protein
MKEAHVHEGDRHRYAQRQVAAGWTGDMFEDVDADPSPAPTAAIAAYRT